MKIVARSFMLIYGSVLNTQQHAKEQSVAEHYQGVLCEEYLEEEPCCKVKSERTNSIMELHAGCVNLSRHFSSGGAT